MRLILTVISIIFLVQANSQDDHYLTIQLGGSGGVASINYEHEILDREVLDLTMRYGFSFAPIDKNNGNALIFPVMLHAQVGRATHFIDVGLGQAFTLTTRGSVFARMPLAIGYRFEPVDKRYYLRASYTPIISYIYNFQWENWGGLTFGYRLNK